MVQVEGNNQSQEHVTTSDFIANTPFSAVVNTKGVSVSLLYVSEYQGIAAWDTLAQVVWHRFGFFHYFPVSFASFITDPK